ncbi:MAG: extracellular solute-binding protein [Clostridium sp.]
MLKKIYIVLCVITLILLFDISKQNSESIIIYSSMEQYRGEELQKQLNQKFPDYDIKVMYVSTGKAAAKISVEKQQSDADIIVGLETSYLEKVKDELADISGMSTLQYLNGLAPEDNDNAYVTWERQAGAFIVNTEVLKKYNLPVPKTYQDLLDTKYQNLIAMPDPKSSGTGYFFYKSLVNAMGEKEALDYIDQLEKNVKQFSESGSGPIKLLIQGEVGIGLGLTFQAVSQINSGSPFQIIYPPEGSPYSLTGTGLMKKCADDNEVVEVFKYIINDFLVYDKQHFSPEPILKNQKNTIENYPQNIQYANMEGISDMQEKERLLKLWKY